MHIVNFQLFPNSVCIAIDVYIELLSAGRCSTSFVSSATTLPSLVDSGHGLAWRGVTQGVAALRVA